MQTVDLVPLTIPAGHERGRTFLSWRRTGSERVELPGPGIIVDMEMQSSTALFVIIAPGGEVFRILRGGGSFQRVNLVLGSSQGVATDLAIDEADRLWILMTDGSVLRLNTDLEVERIFRLAKPASRLVAPRPASLVVLSSASQGSLFQSYTHGGDAVFAFGQLFAGTVQWSNPGQGWMDANSQGAFFYAPLYAGALLSYSQTGIQRFAVPIVGPSEALQTVLTDTGNVAVAPGSKYLTWDLSASADTVVLLTESQSRVEGRILDYYHSDSGLYRGSVRLPSRPRAIEISDTALCVGERTAVECWNTISSAPAGTG